MKSVIAIASFIVIGLVVALFAGFRPHLFGGPVVYDAEQEGLRERIVIRFSHVVAENTPKGLAAEHFAQLVKKKTNDQVEVQVFPNGIQYVENTEVDALRQGKIQMIAPSFSNLSNFIPEWRVLDLPFAFKTENEVQMALDGDVGRILFRTLGSQGMKGLGYWNNGFRQFSSSVRPLVMPGDFQGQRFRIQPSPVIEAQYERLNSETVDIPFNEVYRALENGSADAQENTLSNMYSKKLYRVQNFLTISNHSFLGYAVIMNESFWDSLPPSIQQSIQEAAEETTEWINRKASKLNEQNYEEMRKNSGLEIHTLTEDQRSALIQVLEPVYGQFDDAIGPELMSLIDRLKR